MITLLIWVLILCMFFGLAVYVVQTIPLPQPFAAVALAVVGLVFLLIILSMVVPWPGPLWHYPLR